MEELVGKYQEWSAILAIQKRVARCGHFGGEPGAGARVLGAEHDARAGPGCRHHPRHLQQQHLRFEHHSAGIDDGSQYKGPWRHACVSPGDRAVGPFGRGTGNGAGASPSQPPYEGAPHGFHAPADAVAAGSISTASNARSRAASPTTVKPENVQLLESASANDATDTTPACDISNGDEAIGKVHAAQHLELVRMVRVPSCGSGAKT
eukprot:TRINITY_DN5130_c1_g1_i1.p2 TRINITY_DN5130_c1_g1~~TRINITY_DN5130_c1_g1_i1.p2  ORF type:complete len:216 (+),score=23.49 TRINITY_DN5130_c1_g1_i1:30-650(+)